MPELRVQLLPAALRQHHPAPWGDTRIQSVLPRSPEELFQICL